MSGNSQNTLKCDVLIIGAGMAGVAASIASANLGAHVILVESGLFFGGTAVRALHRDLCGWFANTVELPSSTINDGLAIEFVQRMTREPFLGEIRPMGRVHVLSVGPDAIREMLGRWLAEISGLQTHLQSQFVDVDYASGHVNSVRISIRGVVQTINPGVVIDASGDGAVIGACRAVVSDSQVSERQYAGFSFFVTGIEGSGELLPIEIPYHLAHAVRSGTLPHFAKFTNFAPAHEIHSKSVSGTVKLSVPPGKFETQDAKDFAWAVHAELKKRLPTYANAEIHHLSPYVINRDGLRLRGIHTLRSRDVLAARKFSDGVVKNAWPMEIWDQKHGPQFQYLDPEEYYEIPLRCLKSLEFDNLLAAGRCISVSSRALGSTRVTGPCWSLGEQAGLCAVGIVNGS